MKKHIALLIFIAAFTLFVQNSDAQETEKEIKEAAKERQKTAEKQEKERLKKPAQIEISASGANVGELLVIGFKARNYKLDEKSKQKILMSRIATEVNTYSSTGGAVNVKVIITLKEKADKTNVTINVGMLAPDAFGRIGYVSLDGDKKTRAEIDALLAAVKEKVESGN